MSPFIFIPVFETGGLISKLYDIVLNKICENLVRWKKEGVKLLPISVNLSRKSLVRPDLVDHLTAIVDKYGVEHNLIDFELTESAEDKSQVDRLKELGLEVVQGYYYDKPLPVEEYEDRIKRGK